MPKKNVSDFFDDRTKADVHGAVVEIERGTSAEVVVLVQRLSGFYRHADYLGGITLTFGALALFLYYPEPFSWTLLPLELLGAFAIGAFTVASVDGLRRFIVGRKLLESSVRRAAREAFFDRRVSKTRDRTGILVLVSTFERRVEVVADVGIDQPKLGEPWKDAVQKLDRAVRLDGDRARFVTALRELGVPLIEHYPRAKGDTNELPDELVEPGDDATDSEPSGDEDEDEPEGA